MTNAVRSRVFRYGLIYMALFLASVAIIFLSLYVLVDDEAADLVDAGIRYECERFLRRYAAGDEAAMVAHLEDYVDDHPGNTGLYVLTDPAGRILAGNLGRWPAADLVTDRVTAFTLPAGPEGDPPVTPVRATVCELPGGYRLLVGRNYSGVRGLQRTLRREAVLGLGLTLLLGAVTATYMARSLSTRLERINRTTLEIFDGGLDLRMPLNGSGDEFDRLAVNLNRMLDRIRRLMESMEGVTDNIAHDLRTPLTRLKSRMELALLSDRTADAYRDVLVGSLEDTDRILATFNSLLTIARVRAGTVREGFAQVDLAELVAEAGDFYGPVAEEKGQVLAVAAEGPVPVRGQPGLLGQALANLVDNAVKYSPAGARITLEAMSDGPGGEVRVRDTGTGIPADFRAQAFERFTRLDASRNSPGQGLGLSLVQVVAELHGGTVTLEEGRPGLLVRLRLPGAEA